MKPQYALVLIQPIRCINFNEQYLLTSKYDIQITAYTKNFLNDILSRISLCLLPLLVHVFGMLFSYEHLNVFLCMSHIVKPRQMRLLRQNSWTLEVH